MAKVKVITRTSSETELDMEYPVYLHFQDENCLDTYVRVDDERTALIVRYEIGKTSIERDYYYHIEPHYITHWMSTKNTFETALQAVTELLK